MRIALDLDDVVLDFIGGVLAAIALETGVVIEKDSITGWNFGDYGPDEALGEDWWSWLERKAWLWGGVFNPVPGAINGIEQLRGAGHELEIVTSKPEWAEQEVWRFMGRYKIPVPKVTIVDSTSGKHVNKASVSDATLLVDDRADNVREWVEYDEERIGILYHQPWTDVSEADSRVKVVSTWRGLVNVITWKEEGRGF